MGPKPVCVHLMHAPANSRGTAVQSVWHVCCDRGDTALSCIQQRAQYVRYALLPAWYKPRPGRLWRASPARCHISVFLPLHGLAGACGRPCALHSVGIEVATDKGAPSPGHTCAGNLAGARPGLTFSPRRSNPCVVCSSNVCGGIGFSLALLHDLRGLVNELYV